MPAPSEVSTSRPFRLQAWLPTLVCLLAAALLFQLSGNAARGYIDTSSLFYWWGYQWQDPASETQHGPLVLLVAAWLFWRNLRRSARPSPESQEIGPVEPAAGVAVSRRGYLPGVVLITSALVLHLLGYGMQQTRLSIVALLLLVDGSLRLPGGARGRRWESAARFPLFLLVLAIPFGFLQPLGFYLRLGVSHLTEFVMQALHQPILRSGTQLFSPDGGYQYDVAAACSGIRSLVALVALSWVVGYLRLRSSWRRVLLALLVVPFAFAGNAVRLLVIVGAGARWGQAGGERVHAWSGWLIFAVVLALLLGAARLLARGEEANARGRATDAAAADGEGRADDSTEERKSSAEDRALAVAATVQVEAASPNAGPRDDGPVAKRPGTTASSWGAGLSLLLAAEVALAALGCGALDRRLPAPLAGVRLSADGVDPVELPAFIGTEWIGRQAPVTEVERSILPPDTGYSRKNYISVADRSEVFVSLVLSGRDRTSIHRPELCLVGQGWSILGEERRALELVPGDGLELPVTLLRIEKDFPMRQGPPLRVRALLAYSFFSPDEQVASHAAMVWKSSLARLRRLRGDRWGYLVVQTRSEDGEPATLARMQEVLGPVWQEIKSEK